MEMALVIPLLMLLLTGLVDVGRLLWIRSALEEAAQEGAVYGVLNPTADIEAWIRASSDTPVDLSDPVGVIVDITCASDKLTVIVEHEVELITPYMGHVLGTESRPVTATVVGDLVGGASC